MYDFSVDYDSNDTDDILKYLMKEHNIKCLDLLKKCFAGLQVNVCDTTKCVSLDNQPCQVWPTLVDTNSNEPLYNPLNVSVNKFGGS